MDSWRYLWIAENGYRWLEMSMDNQRQQYMAIDDYGWLEMAKDSYGWRKIDMDGQRQLWMAGDGD